MAIRGIVTPYDVASEVTNEIAAYSRELFFNEYPLASRLDRAPIGVDSFGILSRSPRDTTLTLGGAVNNSTDTSITLSSADELMPGDVLELTSGERVEVQTVNSTSDVVTVVRGVEGTTAAAQNTSTAVTLLYNSRTGAEVDQDAVRGDRTVATQYLHTFQHPVQVGGRANALSNYVAEAGMGNTLLSTQEREALEEFYRDLERAILYGKGQTAGSRTGRWKMKGLRALASAVGNLEDSPTGASTYTPRALIRDLHQALANKGGRGDIMVVSPDFIAAFAEWGHAAQQIDAGSTDFGVPIETFYAPFLGAGVRIIVDMQMEAGSAALLNSSKVRLRYIRQEFYKPRGSRGDAIEGDWLGDFAVDVMDPDRSLAWVENITDYSATGA